MIIYPIRPYQAQHSWPILETHNRATQTKENIVHTDIQNTQVTVQGRRELSAGAKLAHWTAIVCSAGIWYPFYKLAQRTTKNVRY